MNCFILIFFQKQKNSIGDVAANNCDAVVLINAVLWFLCQLAQQHVNIE